MALKKLNFNALKNETEAHSDSYPPIRTATYAVLIYALAMYWINMLMDNLLQHMLMITFSLATYYWLGHDSYKIRSNSFLQFAKDNEFDTSGTAEHIELHSIVKKQGLGSYCTQEVKGVRHGLKFRIFIYSYLNFLGKEKSRQDIQVLEIDLKKQFPLLFLNSKLNDHQFKKPMYKHLRKKPINIHVGRI